MYVWLDLDGKKVAAPSPVSDPNPHQVEKAMAMRWTRGENTEEQVLKVHPRSDLPDVHMYWMTAFGLIDVLPTPGTKPGGFQLAPKVQQAPGRTEAVPQEA